MLLYERVDVAYALLLEYLVDGNKYARLLNIAETIVDGCAKHLHRRTQTHVCVHQRRDVIAHLAHLAVEYAVVVLERFLTEQLLQLLLVGLYFQRFHRYDEIVRVVEMLLKEVQDHVASLAHV